MRRQENSHSSGDSEKDFLDWVERDYGPEVRDQCLRLLHDSSQAREICADLLAEALYCVHKEEIDDAFEIGDHCFTSD